MPDFDNPTPAQLQSSIKSLNFELSNLEPSSMVTLFEIDVSDLMRDKDINIQSDAKHLGLDENTVSDGILRFHNNIKVFNSYVVWQGKTYVPAPIQAEGFESSSRGTLPQPTLSISSQSETGNDQLALLKYEIRKIGDLIGAKVTRKRTFAKYLDSVNFGRNAEAKIGRNSNMLPDGYEPDPFAYLPSDVYFIERKQSENKTMLSYQLSSVLDLEGTKLPKRVILADKCVWQYRGIGCWYQAPYEDEFKDDPSNNELNYPTNVPPLLQKAQVKTLKAEGLGPDLIPAKKTFVAAGTACGMLKRAAPIATDSDEEIDKVIGTALKADKGEFGKVNGEPAFPSDGYNKGDFVYIIKDDIKYYFVCRLANGQTGPDSAISPPNSTYSVADECSKSLTGCRMRWGSGLPKSKGAQTFIEGEDQPLRKGKLPYGGFPAAKKMSRLS